MCTRRQAKSLPSEPKPESVDTQNVLKEVMNEIRELREDVVMNSWLNGTRLELLEKSVEKLVGVLDKIVTLFDGQQKYVAVRGNHGFRAALEKVRKDLLPLFEECVNDES